MCLLWRHPFPTSRTSLTARLLMATAPEAVAVLEVHQLVGTCHGMSAHFGGLKPQFVTMSDMPWHVPTSFSVILDVLQLPPDGDASKRRNSTDALSHWCCFPLKKNGELEAKLFSEVRYRGYKFSAFTEQASFAHFCALFMKI